MDLYPAIDIRGGRCVRLLRGAYDLETVYGDDPAAQARQFEAAGAAWIHVVDLDAARSGSAENLEVVRSVANAVQVPVQAGGGVRSVEAADALFDAGVARVVIGTAALTEPGLVRTLARDHAVAVGIDARFGDVVTDGWTQASGRSVLDVAGAFADAGVRALIVTDVERDGTLTGPDLAGLRVMLGATQVDVIASGGVGSLDDLRDLAGLEADGRRLSGAIVGKALYEGRVDLAEAASVVAADRS